MKKQFSDENSQPDFRSILHILFVLSFVIVASCKNSVGNENLSASHPDHERIRPAVSPSEDRNLLSPADPNADGTDLIRIGLLVERSPQGYDVALSAWYAAELAVRQANDRGGYRGRKFSLVVRSCDGPWGMGSKQAVKLSFDDSVSGIITATYGRNTHLVEQVIAKTHVAAISAWATEPTLTEAFVPWFFRIVPDDRQQARELVENVYSGDPSEKICLLTTGDYDSNNSASAFKNYAHKKEYAEPVMFNYTPGRTSINGLLQKIAGLDPVAVILFGNSSDFGLLIQKIAQSIPSVSFYANSWLDPVDSLAKTIANTGMTINKVTPSFRNNDIGKQFISDYRKTFGHTPGDMAAYVYDGMKMMIEALEKAGMDHDALRDVLRNLDYKTGITGDIGFDEHGNCTVPVNIMQCCQGYNYE